MADNPEVDTPSFEEIEFLHALHPVSHDSSYALSPPLLRAKPEGTEPQCSTCFTVDGKMQTCQRCKGVLYCSKECQKEDWPRHKPFCTQADHPNCTRRLAEGILRISFIVVMLQICAALDVDMQDDEKKEIGFKFPFIVRVDVAIEPSDIRNFKRLFLTDEPVLDKMEGMIQINRIYAYIPDQPEEAILVETRDNLWHRWRDRHNDDPDYRDERLGLIEIVDGSGFMFVAVLTVLSRAVEMASDKQPFERTSSLTGTTFETPLSVAACVEFINTKIRQDKQNQLKLRTEMSEKDKATIREARDKSPTRRAAILLRDKITRELIYANIPLL